jgi:hypothetical protein
MWMPSLQDLDAYGSNTYQVGVTPCSCPPSGRERKEEEEGRDGRGLGEKRFS